MWISFNYVVKSSQILFERRLNRRLEMHLNFVQILFNFLFEKNYKKN